MNILNLFNGMNCGRLALDKLEIPIENYFSSEIDKWAIQITQKNSPDTIQIGCVKGVIKKDLGAIDILMGGSPCQGFSFAGKQLNFDDPRSKLFFDYVKALDHYKPKYFFLENVRMKKEYQDIISSHLGVEPIAINSNLVSAQNRYRLYWTNIPNITQPEDKKIYLKDILESDPQNLTLMSESTIKRFKGYGVPLMDGTEPKARCLGAMEYVKNGKQGNYIMYLVPRGVNKGGPRALDGKVGALTSNAWEQNNFLTNGVRYRKLTPIECERLQTVPDNYTQGVSNTQRYKMLGNGWTIDVIAHCLKNIK